MDNFERLLEKIIRDANIYVTIGLSIGFFYGLIFLIKSLFFSEPMFPNRQFILDINYAEPVYCDSATFIELDHVVYWIDGTRSELKSNAYVIKLSTNPDYQK